MKASLHGVTSEGKTISIASDEIVAIEEGKVDGTSKIICKTHVFIIIGKAEDIAVRWKKSYMGTHNS